MISVSVNNSWCCISSTLCTPLLTVTLAYIQTPQKFPLASMQSCLLSTRTAATLSSPTHPSVPSRNSKSPGSLFSRNAAIRGRGYELLAVQCLHRIPIFLRRSVPISSLSSLSRNELPAAIPLGSWLQLSHSGRTGDYGVDFIGKWITLRSLLTKKQDGLHYPDWRPSHSQILFAFDQHSVSDSSLHQSANPSVDAVGQCKLYSRKLSADPLKALQSSVHHIFPPISTSISNTSASSALASDSDRLALPPFCIVVSSTNLSEVAETYFRNSSVPFVFLQLTPVLSEESLSNGQITVELRRFLTNTAAHDGIEWLTEKSKFIVSKATALPTIQTPDIKKPKTATSINIMNADIMTVQLIMKVMLSLELRDDIY